MKRTAFHIFPFLLLFSMMLQQAAYVVQSNPESTLYILSDSADEKSSEGNETKKLDNEMDDKFVSSIFVSIPGLSLLDSEHRFHYYPADHIIEVVSPPPEMA